MKRSQKLIQQATDCTLRCGLCIALAAACYGGYSVALAHASPILAIISMFAGMALILLAVAEATESIRLRRLSEAERHDEERRSVRPRI